MSLKSCIEELESINKEISLINIRKKKLFDNKKKLEENIKNILKEKEQPGVRHHGIAYKIDKKETRQNKKKKEQLKDIINILKKNNIDNPEKLLNDINEAKKGEYITQEKLKVEKLKK
jgi:hypothetical protein